MRLRGPLACLLTASLIMQSLPLRAATARLKPVKISRIFMAPPATAQRGASALKLPAPAWPGELGHPSFLSLPAPLPDPGDAAAGRAAEAAAGQVELPARAAAPSEPGPSAGARSGPTALPSGPYAQGRPAGGLEQIIWRHALAQGFVRTAAPAEIPGFATLAAAPLSRPTGEGNAAVAQPPARALAQAPRPVRDRTIRGILGSVLAAELWLEAGAFIVPLIAQALSGSFLSVAVVSAGSVLALALGNLLGGPAVDRFGIRPVYVGGLALRAVAAAALCVLYGGGGLGLPALIALFSADYFLTGVNRIGEATLPAVLYGNDVLRINRFGSLKQRVIETAGIIGPILVGQVIAASGFAPALAIFAGGLGLAAVLAALTVRPPPARSASSAGRFGAAWHELGRNATLRWAAAGFGLCSAVSLWLYLMVGQAISLHIAGTAEGAAGILGWITGLFCVGGFAGAWLNVRLAKNLDARTGLESVRRAFIGSTRKWLAAAALSLLGLWALLWPGALPAYLAIVPLGMAFGGALVQSESLLKSEAPESMRATVVGLVSALALAATALGYFPLGWIFDRFSGSGAGALAALAALATVLSGAFLLISRKLAAGGGHMRRAAALGMGLSLLAARGPDLQVMAPGAPAAPALTSLSELARRRPAADILAEIRDISLQVEWERWLEDIERNMESDGSNVWLALDARERVVGFLILADRYVEEATNTTRVLPGRSYVAYMAARRDATLKGIGQSLFLAAARSARRAGADELRLHVRKDSPAVGFYKAMSKLLPLKSQTEDAAYVRDEIWLLTVYDLAGLAEAR